MLESVFEFHDRPRYSTALLSSRAGALLDAWIAAIGRNTGPLLRPVYRNRVRALHLEPLSVGRVLKKLSTRANLPTTGSSKVSGHSLRVGAAQQLVLNGRGILEIMRAGGWRSINVVARYVENVDLDIWG
jgi:Phage integrase family.